MNNIENSLMEMYLEKLYQSELITFSEMEEIRETMNATYKNKGKVA